MKFAGERVLVTGGAGFIGSHIVDLLLDHGCRVVALDNFVRGRRENLAAALAHPKCSVLEGDIRDRDLMRRLVGATDVVIHQAALRLTRCAEEPRAALEVMVDASFDLIELCANAGVRKVVFASSASVYGMAEAFPTPECHHPYADRTLYGTAKLFAEGVLRAFSETHGLRYVALRYFNVYGPRMDLHGRYTEVLIRWMERIESGLPPVIFGDGRQSMDFIHVRDVARANLLAVGSDVTDEVFNVASGRETSLLELAAELSASMGQPWLAPEIRSPRKISSVARRLGDIANARRSLGFASEIPLRAGLDDLVAWWRSERQVAAIMPSRRATP